MSKEDLLKISQNVESLNNEIRSSHDQLTEINRQLEKISKGARYFHLMFYFMLALPLLVAIPVIYVIWSHFPGIMGFISEHSGYLDRFR